MALLIAFALIGLAAGGVVNVSCSSLVETDYHNKIGIPLATQLKAAEDSLDLKKERDRIAGLVGNYPLIGGVVITLTTGQTSVCGSSLLTNTRGVTAAHCWRTLLAQARSFTVVYSSTLLFSGGTRVTTTDVETHANYNMTTLVNDIALIRIPWVNFSRNVKPIALATDSINYVGTWFLVATWGRTSDSGRFTKIQSLSNVLLQVITNAECQATYGSSIQASNICVTTAGRGSCVGGSGGPLTDAAQYRLIGVTSFGHHGSCQGGTPAVFTRVSAFAAWLQARL